MRKNLIRGFLYSITLLAFGSASLRALAQEVPSISVRPNSPGWITVYWSHSGFNVSYLYLDRQDLPSPYKLGLGASGQITDAGLHPSTTYKYRVCAVYGNSPTCSGWASATTFPPQSSPPSNSSSGGTPPPPPPKHQLRTPNLTATSTAPNFITLHWGSDSSDLYTLGNVQLYRDGQITYDAKKYGGFVADYSDGGKMYDSATKQWSGQPLRPNTEYSYKVYFIGFGEAQGQTTWSKDIIAIGKPIAPTAPGNVLFNKIRVPGGRRGVAATLRTVINVSWRNPDISKGEIPGQYITVEREDRVMTGGKAVLSRLFTNAWIQILPPIKAKGDPTETALDLTSPGPPNPMDHPGNNYRVCSLVPALGAAGKVCSPPTTVP